MAIIVLIPIKVLTNENPDNGTQKATRECGVSFKQALPKIILFCNLLD